MIAPSSAWSSPYAVSIRHAVSGSAEQISRQTVTPSPSGNRTSRTATSGRSAGIRASGRRRGFRLADDLDVWLAGEQGPDAPPEDFVVIDQEHADPARLSAVFGHRPPPFRAWQTPCPAVRLPPEAIPWLG